MPTYIRTYYGLYFSGSGGVIRLPINPEKLPITRDNDNKEYNVLGIGPIMVPRTPKLRELKISSFFPGRGGDTAPETYIRFFENALASREVIAFVPVRFYETGEPFAAADTGFECLVTEFVTEERGAETGDFYFDLTCTEYRDYTPQRVQAAGSRSGYASGASSASLARSAATTIQASASPLSLRVMAAPARSIPQGQLYAGAIAIANGTVYQTSERGGATQQLSGQRAYIMRIDADAPSGVYITTEDGTAIGWIAADALQVVSDT